MVNAAAMVNLEAALRHTCISPVFSRFLLDFYYLKIQLNIVEDCGLTKALTGWS